jgi:hypothetical protein
MSGIYVINMAFNFLLQATKVLHSNQFDENELDIIYEYMCCVSDETLNEYKKNITILSYNNDLELYTDIVNKLISVFSEREEYEKCARLVKKINQVKSLN